MCWNCPNLESQYKPTTLLSIESHTANLIESNDLFLDLHRQRFDLRQLFQGEILLLCQLQRRTIRLFANEFNLKFSKWISDAILQCTSRIQPIDSLSIAKSYQDGVRALPSVIVVDADEWGGAGRRGRQGKLSARDQLQVNKDAIE